MAKATTDFNDDLDGELDDLDDDDLDDDYPSEEPFADEDPPLDDQYDDSEDGDELSGLEGEELNMVEKGVPATVLTSEQAMEVAGIRRAELSINPDDYGIRLNEFQCEACFLVKRLNQRSAPGSSICVDCH